MAAVIALLVRALGWLIASGALQWVLKVFVGLGVGIATTKVALPALKAYVMHASSGLGSELYQVFGAIGGDVAMAMILSAYAAALTGNLVLKALKK